MIHKLLAVAPSWMARRRWLDPSHLIQKLMGRAGLEFTSQDDGGVEALDGMSRREALFLYTLMYAARAFSEKSVNLQRTGTIRFAICGFGHEGFQAALATELEEYAGGADQTARDEGAFYYRGQTFCLAMGSSLLDLMRLNFALPSDDTGGTQMPVMFGNTRLGIIPVTADVGAAAPVAVGRAKSKVLLGEPGVVIVSMGEGTTRAAPVTSSEPEALARVLPRRLRVAVSRAASPDMQPEQVDILSRNSEAFETAKAEVLAALKAEIPPQFEDRKQEAIRAVRATQTPDEFKQLAVPAIHKAFPAQTPVIFAVEDNDHGISVARDQVLPGGLPPEQGPEGMLFIKVDGADVLASRRAWKEALAHTRARKGPVKIWADLPRLRDHSTSDDAGKYVPAADRMRAAERDPISKWRTQLLEANVADEQLLENIDAAIAAALSEALDSCRGERKRDPQADPEGSWREIEAHHSPAAQYEPAASALILTLGSERKPVNTLVGTNRVLHEAFREARERGLPLQPLYFGEDVGDGIRALRGDIAVHARAEMRLPVEFGGVFGFSRGLERVNPDGLVFNMGIAEDQILGAAVGYALSGRLLPIAEIQFRDYVSSGLQQLWDVMVTMAARTGGRTRLPIVVRMHSGGYLEGAGGYGHSESALGPLMHYPGCYIICPSTPYDAIGMRRYIFRMLQAGHWIPVIDLEPKAIRTLEAEYFPENYEVPIGKAKVWKEGSDITLFSYGNTMHLMRVVAALLEHDDDKLEQYRKKGATFLPRFAWYGIDRSRQMMNGMPRYNVGLVDLRSLAPLDIETCLTQLTNTHGVGLVGDEDREAGGAAPYIAALLGQEHFLRTGEPSYVWFKGAKPSRVPFGSSEQAVLPQTYDFLGVALALLNR